MEYGYDWVVSEYDYSVGLEVWTKLFSCRFDSQRDLLKIGIPRFNVCQHLTHEIHRFLLAILARPKQSHAHGHGRGSQIQVEVLTIHWLRQG